MLFFLPSIPAAIANAPGGSRHTARAISLAITAEALTPSEMGRGKQGGEEDEELQPRCMSVTVHTHLISHNYIKGGGLAVWYCFPQLPGKSVNIE
jgi:hypothetical protein